MKASWRESPWLVLGVLGSTRIRGLIRAAMVGIVGIVVAVAGCASPPQSTLEVATLNIAHGRGLAFSQVGLPKPRFEANLDAIADLLRRERPDVVGLQEADAPSAWSGRFDHINRLADAAEFPYRHHGIQFDRGVARAHLRYGTALMARMPMTETASYDFDARVMDSKGFVTAEIEFDHRPILVVSVHLDPLSAATRCKQADLLIDTLTASKHALVVLGDFNCAWTHDDALRRIATSLGLQVYQPQSSDYMTYPSVDPKRRVDWILCSRNLRFVGYRVWHDQVSDHRGVVADLCWVDR
jgi:endonuclease/exonuclease/phosphatase family metal-dependent hydrolase